MRDDTSSILRDMAALDPADSDALRDLADALETASSNRRAYRRSRRITELLERLQAAEQTAQDARREADRLLLAWSVAMCSHDADAGSYAVEVLHAERRYAVACRTMRETRAILAGGQRDAA